MSSVAAAPRPHSIRAFAAERHVDLKQTTLAMVAAAARPVARWHIVLAIGMLSIGCGNPTSGDDYYWIYRVRGVVRDEASAVVPGALVRVEAFAGVCPPASGTPPQSASPADENGIYRAAYEWRGAFDGCVRITAAHPGGASYGSASIERQGVSLASPQTDSLIVDLTLHRP